MCASKKGISTNQIQRMLSCSMKTAWFLGHRIREAMRDGDLSPMGGAGAPVEADETFIGRKEGKTVSRGYAHKNVVLTLVERKGRARSFHVEGVKKNDLAPIVRANIAKEAHLMTDKANQYTQIGKEFAAHGKVDHSREEYAYRDRITGVVIGVNCAEGLLLHLQARHDRHLSALQRAASSQVFGGIRFPLLAPHQNRL